MPPTRRSVGRSSPNDEDASRTAQIQAGLWHHETRTSSRRQETDARSHGSQRKEGTDAHVEGS